MGKSRAKILVVEDDPAIRRGLLDVLAFNGFSPEGAEDGREGRDRALSEHHDLVILDVMLPGMDGFSVCRELRAGKPAQPILMLTAKGAEDDVVAGFQAGADDYVSKPFSLRELMVRIESLLRRSGRSVGDETVRWGELELDGRTLTGRRGDRIVELTRREMDILVYLDRRKDRIVSKGELLTEVWGYADPEIETRTVDVHMLKLRKKLAELAGETPVIRTVRGEGYRMEPAP
ncbi:MAG: response regulator transcription factor [Desulfococcaceae bacterium]